MWLQVSIRSLIKRSGLTLMPWRPGHVLGSIKPSWVLRRVRGGPVFVVRVRDEGVKVINRHCDGVRQGFR
jgi:hypothetical protein